jgi:hypothetical protein
MEYDFDIQDYLFDLRGYIILKKAVSPDLVERLNRAIDPYLDLQYLEWRGNVQRFDNNGNAGIELQNIVEGGKPFEELIDHPAWYERLLRYGGEKGTYVEGLFIDECFVRSGGQGDSSRSIPGTRMASYATSTVSSTTSSAVRR